MKKALITGVYGFTGAHLSRYLLGQEADIHGLDSREIARAGSDHPVGGLHLYAVDIRIRSRVAAVINGLKPDFIFHLAGLISSNDAEMLRATNIAGTENVLEAAGRSNIKVLIPGSAAEYGRVENDRMPVNEKEEARPVSAYGRSKAEQTRLGLRYFSEQGRRVYIARPFNIIGPGQPQSLLCSAIARQVVRIEQSRQKPVVEIGNLDPVRDFIDVRDVARAYWDIVSKGIPGEIYNICSGRPLSVRDIIDMLGSISGVKFDIKQVPELVRMSDIPVMVGDNSKIRAATGWQPAITVEQTLKDILQELRADPSLTK